MQRRWWISVCALWMFVVPVTRAQVSASDKAAAEALFDRGLALMREGKLDEACARLEQSNAIERGIGTMLYLAECYEKQGRTASAWALFREASSQAQAAGQFERATAGRQRAESLEPSLAKLMVEVPDGSNVEGLELTRNGAPLAPALWGVPLPVDPGRLVIEARAPGYLPATHTVLVEKGPHVARFELERLSPAPTPEAAALPAVTAPGPVSAPAPVAPPPEPKMNKLKLSGLILGSAGAALLVVGAGFGGRAIRQNNIADENCRTRLCNAKGKDASDAAQTAAVVADVGIIGGAALLVGGALTYFLAPATETRVAVNASGRGFGLSVGGVF